MLKDVYRVSGFRPLSRLVPDPHDPDGHVLTLRRRQKKRYVQGAVQVSTGFVIGVFIVCGILMQAPSTSTLTLNTGGWPACTVTPWNEKLFHGLHPRPALPGGLKTLSGASVVR